MKRAKTLRKYLVAALKEDPANPNAAPIYLYWNGQNFIADKGENNCNVRRYVNYHDAKTTAWKLFCSDKFTHFLAIIPFPDSSIPSPELVTAQVPSFSSKS